MGFSYHVRLTRTSVVQLVRSTYITSRQISLWKTYFEKFATPIIERFQDDLFRQGGRGRWQSLKPRYRRWKAMAALSGMVRKLNGKTARVQFFPENIGRLTGTLHKAMSSESAYGRFFTATEKKMERGVNPRAIKYARRFNSIREFIIASPDLGLDLTDAANRYLRAQLRIASARSNFLFRVRT